MKVDNNILWCSIFVIALTLSIADRSNAITSIMKPTTVVGFINTGEPADDNVNIIITKSLINFLSKIPNAAITSYDQTEKSAAKTGYWKRKKTDKEQAISIAQTFDSKQLIVGDYRVDRQKRTIDIRVHVFDVVTGELKLSRSYAGSSGVDLFDTIENMTRNISGLLAGKAIDLVDLNVTVTGSGRSYRLFVNGRPAGVISDRKPYADQVIQEENIEVIIRHISNDQELYRVNKKTMPKETVRIDYQPMGSTVVQNMLEDGVLFLDGVRNQPVVKNKTVTINNVRASVPHTLELTMKTGSVRKDFTLEEGETMVVILGGDASAQTPVRVPVNYYGVQPLWNLLLPGLAQYQAKDPWMGSLFIAVAVAGAGLFAFSEISFMDSFDRYIKATTVVEAEKYYAVSETWRNLGITGLAIWTGSALLSVLHASIQPSRLAALDGDGFSFNIAYRGDDMNLFLSRSF